MNVSKNITINTLDKHKEDRLLITLNYDNKDYILKITLVDKNKVDIFNNLYYEAKIYEEISSDVYVKDNIIQIYSYGIFNDANKKFKKTLNREYDNIIDKMNSDANIYNEIKKQMINTNLYTIINKKVVNLTKILTLMANIDNEYKGSYEDETILDQKLELFKNKITGDEDTNEVIEFISNLINDYRGLVYNLSDLKQDLYDKYCDNVEINNDTIFKNFNDNDTNVNMKYVFYIMLEYDKTYKPCSESLCINPSQKNIIAQNIFYDLSYLNIKYGFHHMDFHSENLLVKFEDNKIKYKLYDFDRSITNKYMNNFSFSGNSGYQVYKKIILFINNKEKFNDLLFINDIKVFVGIDNYNHNNDILINTFFEIYDKYKRNDETEIPFIVYDNLGDEYFRKLKEFIQNKYKFSQQTGGSAKDYFKKYLKYKSKYLKISFY